MNFNHQQYVEIYSALKEGCWVNQEVRQELVERLEQYMIRVAMHNDFYPKNTLTSANAKASKEQNK